MDTTNWSDEDLRKHFADLNQLHIAVEGILRRNALPAEDADDVVQEVYLIIERLDTSILELASRHFKAWLYQVARNVFLRKLRRNANSADPTEPENVQPTRSLFQLSKYSLSLGVRLIACVSTCWLTVEATKLCRQMCLSLRNVAKMRETIAFCPAV